MTPAKPAGREDVPEDVANLAASYAGRIADILLGKDGDGLVPILAEAIMADRSRRAKAPAEETELAPDVKGLVAQIEALLDLDARDVLVPHGIGGLARDLLSRSIVALSRLSAPPAEATSAYLNAAGIPELPVSYPVDWRAHPAEHGLTPLYKHPAPPAEAKPVAWSVKPLEWRKLSDAKTADTYGCRSIAGFSFGQYFVNSSAYGSRWNFSRLGYAEIEAASEEDAKAAAQADYEQRITSAIIVHPDPRAKAAEAVPEGMVLVPREPTEAMRDAGFAAPYQAPMAVYRAMLAAAPQPLSRGVVNGD